MCEPCPHCAIHAAHCDALIGLIYQHGLTLPMVFKRDVIESMRLYKRDLDDANLILQAEQIVLDAGKEHDE